MRQPSSVFVISMVKRAGVLMTFPSLVCENVSIPANRTAFSETTMVEYSSIVMERGVIVHRAPSRELLNDSATLDRLIGLRIEGEKQ